MRDKYTLRQICEIEGIKVPEIFKESADDEISKVTCFGSRMTEGGALFPRGLTEDGKKAPSSYNESGALTAVKKGAKFIFSEEQYFDKDGDALPCVIVKDSRELFMKVMQDVRKGFSDKTRVIAITGSIGKTSTTDMVELVASTYFKTYASKKNTNGFASIANHMQRIEDDVEVYIQEVGAYFPGLIDEGAKMLCPDACIVTNIGTSHIDLYGTVEKLAHDKLGVARRLKEGGTAFLNYDDPILRKAKLDCNIVWYSAENKNADYYAKDIVYGDGYIEYDIVCKEESTHVRINSYAEHNIINSVVAYAYGKMCGLTGEQISKAFLNFKTDGMRQNLCNIGDYRLFIDCFNSAPNSLESAVKTITKIPVAENRKRVAVLADMLKMGDLSKKLHIQSGKVLAGYDVDLFICYGPFMKYMARRLKRARKNVLYTNDRDELNRLVSENVMPGDLALFKGGHKMALSKTLDDVYGTSFYLTDIDVIQEKGKDLDSVQFVGKNIDGMVEIRKFKSDEETKAVIPSKLKGIPVVRVGNNSFGRKKMLKEVIIEEGIVSIGEGAFYICSSLKTLVLPKTLKVIERSAFNYCIELEEVEIPENVSTLGARAFYDCRRLKKVFIGDNVRFIDKEAFANCPNVVIFCNKDSYAYEYARKNNLKCVLAGEKIIETDEFRVKAFNDETTILAFKSDEASSVVVPSVLDGSTVVRIGENAFNRKRQLEEVVVEEGVTSIGEGAFYICPALKKLILPKTLNVIERSAFNYCTSLEEVEIPENVSSLGVRAFFDCRKLKKIVVGNQVKFIGREAFDNCPNVVIYCGKDSYAYEYAKKNGIKYVVDGEEFIETVEFYGKKRDGKVEIERFRSNEAISIVVPAELEEAPVVRIGNNAFNRRRKLEEVIFEDGILSIGEGAFYICPALKKLVLPKTLKVIERSAFNYCTSLEEVEIPESVTSLGLRAFYDCQSLKRITIGENVKEIGGEAFVNCPNVVICCKKDSYAHEYALHNGIKVELI